VAQKISADKKKKPNLFLLSKEEKLKRDWSHWSLAASCVCLYI